MIKAVCDFTGKTPAVPVQLVADGKVLLSLDLCQNVINDLVQELMGKMQVSDVQAVLKGKV